MCTGEKKNVVFRREKEVMYTKIKEAVSKNNVLHMRNMAI